MTITTWPPEDRTSPILIRVYSGKSEAALLIDFHRDAELLLAQGFQPAGQHYIEGSWPSWYVAVVTLLCFVVIGFMIAISMLLGPRPTGALAVTYVRRAA
jgi:hypothetical protein